MVAERPSRRASPWAALGLRRNPFGEPPADEVAELVVPDESDPPPGLLDRPGVALQVLGEAGRGKTARLRWLAARYPRAPYVYLPAGGRRPRLPAISGVAGPVALLLDEAQRLPRRARRRLFRSVSRHGLSLALASHDDLEGELAASGLTPTTTVVAGLTPEQLLRIVDRRIDRVRLPAGEPLRLDRDDAARLIRRHGDDLRGILDRLYEVYQLALGQREGEAWRSAI